MQWNRHAGVNRYRTYAVTVMDGWTPMRLFWTLRGAMSYYDTFLADDDGPCAHVYRWNGEFWKEV